MKLDAHTWGNELIDIDSNLENAGILGINQEAEVENAGVLRIDQEVRIDLKRGIEEGIDSKGGIEEGEGEVKF